MYTLDQVFAIHPRSGESYWYKRNQNEENDLADLYTSNNDISIVVVEGPTGAGKTSLAYRTMYLTNANFNYISVDSSTTWVRFCKEVVSVPKIKSNETSIKLEFSLKNLLPSGKIDAEHKKKYDALKDIQYSDEYINHVTDYMLVEIMQKEEVTIIIDEMEKASKEFIAVIADFAKKLSNTINTTNAGKLILISTKGTYTELIYADITLQGRISHITLGGLRSPTEMWNFLTGGFNSLEIVHPEASKLRSERAKINQCKDFIFDSTGGILKYLTNLGNKLAKMVMLSDNEKKYLYAKTLVNVAKEMAQDNINDYYTLDEKLVECISTNEDVRKVINYQYKHGPASYHKIADIQDFYEREQKKQIDQGKKAKEIDIEKGISILEKNKYLVRTGKNGNIVFPIDPFLTLALSVCISRNGVYSIPKIYKTLYRQLYLDFS